MKVLYVEDNVLDVDLTRREIGKLAPEISLDIASTMKEAMAILADATATKYQAVLTDLRLPDGDGLAVLAAIRERGLPLAVVLVTSSGDEETAVAALKAGANDYIVKHPGYLKRLPFTLENAIQQFRSLTSRSTRLLRVLYAEHNQVDVDLTRRHFARQSPHIRLDVVSGAEQIYNRLKRETPEPYEVLLLDYRLPGQTGLDILKDLRANHHDIPVVIVTGQGDEEVALQAIKLGALDYVIKNPGYLYRLPYILETARDTAERAREHAALEESQSRLQALFNNALNSFLLTDDQTRFLAANPTACLLLGYSHDELLNMRLADIVASPSADELEANQAELLRVGKQLGEMSLCRKDGSLIETEYHAVANIVPGVHLTVHRDVTARKQAEARTRVEAARALALAQVALRLNAQMDLQAVLGVVCEEAAAALGVPAVLVMLHDVKTQALLPAQAIGLPSDFLQRVNPINIEAVKPYLSNNGDIRPITLNDMVAARYVNLEQIFVDQHIHSVAGVGMLRDEQIQGVIFVLAKDQPREFSLDEIDLLRAITAQAAQAVANARLFEENLRKTRRAESLARMASRLNTQLELKAVLQVVCEETARALDTTVAMVGLFDSAHQNFTELEYSGLPPEAKQHIKAVPLELMQRRADENGFVVVPDLQDIQNAPNAAVASEFVMRSFASTFFPFGEGQIGQLAIFSLGQVKTFEEEDLALLRALADYCAQAVDKAHLFGATQRQLKHVQALRRNDTAIASSTDLHVVLRGIIEEATALLDIDAVDVMLLNFHTLQLTFADGMGFRSNAWRSASLRLGEGNAGRAAMERMPVCLPDLIMASVAPTRQNAAQFENFQAYFAVPLISKGKVRGVLEAMHRSPLEPDHEWLDLLEALGNQAALALDNASLFESLERSNTELLLTFDRTIEGWSRALDLRDKETEGHTLRVTDVTLQLAAAMGMSEEDLVHIRRGSLLHDIGKMGVPDHILLKEGPLTDDEWRIMREHPKLAYDLLAPIAFMQPALDIPYCHHEKWDGSGYPRGLVKEQIPLAGRIFSVVDVWDALRSKRPYRDAWPEEKVRDYILTGSGSHFDPEVVIHFNHLLEANPQIGALQHE